MEKLDVEQYLVENKPVIPFITPFNMLISGETGAGNSYNYDS